MPGEDGVDAGRVWERPSKSEKGVRGGNAEYCWDDELKNDGRPQTWQSETGQGKKINADGDSKVWRDNQTFYRWKFETVLNHQITQVSKGGLWRRTCSYAGSKVISCCQVCSALEIAVKYAGS